MEFIDRSASHRGRVVPSDKLCVDVARDAAVNARWNASGPSGGADAGIDTSACSVTVTQGAKTLIISIHDVASAERIAACFADAATQLRDLRVDAGLAVPAPTLGADPVLQRYIYDGTKQAGTYESGRALSMCEESLTLGQYALATRFLDWLVAQGLSFGHGNYADRIAQFDAAQTR